jgi:hypothetical protein
VLGIDLYQQGEFLADGKPLERQRMVTNSVIGGYAGYTYGYNASLFSQRVHDVLSAIAFARDHAVKPERIDLIGFGKAGLWAAAAKAQAGDTVSRLAIDTAGFRFAKLTDLASPEFLPGIVKYGDVPALLALAAPGELWLAGETTEPPAMVLAAYTASGQPGKLVTAAGDAASVDAATTWLIGQ